MANYEKVFLDIGAGTKFERAHKIAAEHRNWLVIAIDLAIKTVGTKVAKAAENLIISNYPFQEISTRLPKFLSAIGQKVDIVEINYSGIQTPPIHPSSTPIMFRWIIEDPLPSWLGENAEVYIRLYPDKFLGNREIFNHDLGLFEKIVQNHWSIEVVVEENPHDWPITKSEIIARRETGNIRVTLKLTRKH